MLRPPWGFRKLWAANAGALRSLFGNRSLTFGLREYTSGAGRNGNSAATIF